MKKTKIRIIESGTQFRIEFGRKFLFWYNWKRFKLPYPERGLFGESSVKEKEYFRNKEEATRVALAWADVAVVRYKGFEIKPVSTYGRQDVIEWYTKPLMPEGYPEGSMPSQTEWKYQIDRMLKRQKEVTEFYKEKIHNI